MIKSATNTKLTTKQWNRINGNNVKICTELKTIGIMERGREKMKLNRMHGINDKTWSNKCKQQLQIANDYTIRMNETNVKWANQCDAINTSVRREREKRTTVDNTTRRVAEIEWHYWIASFTNRQWVTVKRYRVFRKESDIKKKAVEWNFIQVIIRKHQPGKKRKQLFGFQQKCRMHLIIHLI